MALAALLVAVSACSDGPGPARVPREVTLSVTTSGNGTVSVDGVARQTPYQRAFVEGTVVTLGADPAPGHLFVGWDGDLSGQQNPVAVTMAGARTVIAVFEELPPSAPPNDAFAQRLPLTGASGSTAGSNVGASRESGEPDHRGQPGGASVWWTWTAPASGPVAFALTGAAFDAVVAAYTGDDLVSLQPVSPPAPAAQPSVDEVAFEAVAETAYHLAVDGVAGDQGAFTLAWDMAAEPPPPGSADLVATPDQLTFVGLPGDAAPPAQALELTNEGNVGAAFAVTSDRTWITADPSAGSVPAGATATLSVGVHPCATDGLATGSLTVSGGGQARTVSVTRDCRTAPPSTALTIERVYVNQAVPAQDTQQAPTGRLPAVADRAGLLRVFASASEAGTSGAQATLHVRHGGGGAATLPLTGPASVPTSVSEATLDHSFDAVLPAGLVRHGLELYVELTAEADGQPLSARYPASGYWTLDVTGVPDANMTLVPVTYDGTTPSLGDGAAYLDFTQRVFPLGQATVDIQVRQPFAFGGNLSPNGDGWKDLLDAITGLRSSDGSNRHYLAVVDPGYGSGVAGIAWVVGPPVAIVWSHLQSAAHVAAHELAHNWGLWHAPCGNPGNVDPDFPYADGGIGVWGYDLVAGALKSPSTFRDLMGYCSPPWVSDYHYGKVLSNRQAYGYGVSGEAEGTRPLLIVSGWFDGEDAQLGPLIVTRGAVEPPADGPYQLVAWGHDGREAVRVAFDTRPLSLGSLHGFYLTLPAPAVPLAGVRIERDGRPLVERSASLRPAAAAPARVERLADGRATVVWDARAYAVAWVRDGVDGPLLAQDARGRVTVTPTAGSLTLLLSDGLNTDRVVLDF